MLTMNLRVAVQQRLPIPRCTRSCESSESHANGWDCFNANESVFRFGNDRALGTNVGIDIATLVTHRLTQKCESSFAGASNPDVPGH